VIFTDEWGGGTRPRCRATDLPNWGANAIFEIVDRRLQFASYYKMPAAQTEQENCVAHNGSLIPVPGRDIMVQAWYQGGVSVFDFTDASKPVEIAFFDRGPIDGKHLITAGFWSTYWTMASSTAPRSPAASMSRADAERVLSQNEIDAALLVKATEFNAQQQPKVTWPASSTVARAYLDQLTRGNAIQPQRAAAVTAALERVDKIRSGRDAGATATPELKALLDALAAELEGDARKAAGRDAVRLQSLAGTIKGL
jgi:hypothetical protein